MLVKRHRQLQMSLTGAGEGHTAVLLLGWCAFVGTSRSDGEGRGSRKGTAVIVKLPARRHHHTIVEGKQGELCREREKSQVFTLLW